MRQLLLLRHAEAEPAAPGGADALRPLTEHGRDEAAQAADCLGSAGLRIDALLVSGARRTEETAAIVVGRLGLRVPVERQTALYLAAPWGLLQALCRCDDRLRTVLLIGHNPGISEFARQLIDGDETVSLRTAGLCQIVLPSIPWRELGPAMARTFAILR
jgi:phosphohistidine phosphatase SixA